MAKRYKVLREGISQRDGEGWKYPKVGDLIELSEAAAAHLLSEEPPYIELSAEAPRRTSPIRPQGEKEE